MSAGDDEGHSQELPNLRELTNGQQLLAEQIEDLADRIAGLETLVAEAHVATTKAITDLHKDVDELQETKACQDIQPTAWVDRATTADWAELADWVDWLQAIYDFKGGFDIHPCWPLHRGVTEELAGIWHAWRRAVITDELAPKAANAELAAWHDRWLWPTLSRITVGNNYRFGSCSKGHEPGRATPIRTDRDHLPSGDDAPPEQ